jgi:hypothetical protein
VEQIFIIISSDFFSLRRNKYSLKEKSFKGKKSSLRENIKMERRKINENRNK